MAVAAIRAPLHLVVMDTAAAYLHVREHGGHNRGHDVDRLNRMAGVALASNWCMSYVYGMWHLASVGIGVSNPMLRTGAVWRQLAHARRIGSGLTVIPCGGVFASRYRARPGDVGIMSTRGTQYHLIGASWTGHTYLVRDDRGATVGTREGNTNNDGSRNGNRVCDRLRRKDETLAFIRYDVASS